MVHAWLGIPLNTIAEQIKIADQLTLKKNKPEIFFAERLSWAFTMCGAT